jgi:hypothetical protein
MSLVRVHWTESVSYSADLEIDGYDPDADDRDEVLDEAICELEGQEWKDAFDSVDERSVASATVVREGELAVAVVRDAPAHEPDWED